MNLPDIKEVKKYVQTKIMWDISSLVFEYREGCLHIYEFGTDPKYGSVTSQYPFTVDDFKEECDSWIIPHIKAQVQAWGNKTIKHIPDETCPDQEIDINTGQLRIVCP